MARYASLLTKLRHGTRRTSAAGHSDHTHNRENNAFSILFSCSASTVTTAVRLPAVVVLTTIVSNKSWQCTNLLFLFGKIHPAMRHPVIPPQLGLKFINKREATLPSLLGNTCDDTHRFYTADPHPIKRINTSYATFWDRLRQAPPTYWRYKPPNMYCSKSSAPKTPAK